MSTNSQITFHMFKMCVEKREYSHEVHNAHAQGLHYLYYWYRERETVVVV